jgi:hypothetical protein
MSVTLEKNTNPRHGFESKTYWSTREVSILSGRAESTIRRWIADKCFYAHSDRTLFRIYAPDCRHFLNTGEKRYTPLHRQHATTAT